MCALRQCDRQTKFRFPEVVYESLKRELTFSVFSAAFFFFGKKWPLAWCEERKMLSKSVASLILCIASATMLIVAVAADVCGEFAQPAAVCSSRKASTCNKKGTRLVVCDIDIVCPVATQRLGCAPSLCARL